MKLVILVILPFLTTTVFADSLTPQERKQIMAGAARLKNAFHKGDHTVPVEMMPDNFFKLNNISKQKMLTVSKLMTSRLKKAGLKVISLKYSEPATAYKCKFATIAFVPGKTLIEVNGSRVASQGFMIASRKVSQKKWRFLDGAHPRARLRPFYDSMYGCQGVKLKIPAFSVKVL